MAAACAQLGGARACSGRAPAPRALIGLRSHRQTQTMFSNKFVSAHQRASGLVRPPRAPTTGRATYQPHSAAAGPRARSVPRTQTCFRRSIATPAPALVHPGPRARAIEFNNFAPRGARRFFDGRKRLSTRSRAQTGAPAKRLLFHLYGGHERPAYSLRARGGRQSAS